MGDVVWSGPGGSGRCTESNFLSDISSNHTRALGSADAYANEVANWLTDIAAYLGSDAPANIAAYLGSDTPANIAAQSPSDARADDDTAAYLPPKFVAHNHPNAFRGFAGTFTTTSPFADASADYCPLREADAETDAVTNAETDAVANAETDAVAIASTNRRADFVTVIGAHFAPVTSAVAFTDIRAKSTAIAGANLGAHFDPVASAVD